MGDLTQVFHCSGVCASTSLQHCCYFQHCAPVPTYHGFNTCCFWALDISSVEPSYCCPWWPMNLHQRHGALQPRVSSVGSVTSVLPCPASLCPGWCNPWAGRHTSTVLTVAAGCGSFAGAALAQPTQLEAKSGDGTSLSRSEAEFVAGLMLKDKRKMYRDV